MKYVSIDLEASGLDRSRCVVLEVGAVFDDLLTPFDGERAARTAFHAYVLHDHIPGEPFALNLNREIIAKIAGAPRDGRWMPGNPSGDNFLKPREVCTRFRQWLLCHGLDPAEPVNAAGKNFGSLDRPWLEALPKWNVQFRHRVLDPSILYLRPEDDVVPGLGECKRRAGLPGTVAHRATDDAMDVVCLLRRHFDRS